MEVLSKILERHVELKINLGNKCITDEKVVHSIALQFIKVRDLKDENLLIHFDNIDSVDLNAVIKD